MNKIIKANRGRITVANAKRAIVAASPMAEFVEFPIDEHKQPTDEPATIVLRPQFEDYIGPTFLGLCANSTLRPLHLWRPDIAEYQSERDDAQYTISHDEFVTLAELCSIAVEVESSEITSPESHDFRDIDHAIDLGISRFGIDADRDIWESLVKATDAKRNPFLEVDRDGQISYRDKGKTRSIDYKQFSARMYRRRQSKKSAQ